MSPETTNLPKMYLSSKKQKHTFISFGKNVLKFKMLPHVGANNVNCRFRVSNEDQLPRGSKCDSLICQ